MRARRALAALVFLTLASTARAESFDQALARIDSLLGSFRGQQATAILDSLLPAARAANDSTRLLELLQRKGPLLASFGHAREAEPLLREGIDRASALGDDAVRCGLLRWLSIAVDGQGRRAEADSLFHELLEMSAARGYTELQGWALVGLAWHDFEAGRNYDSILRYRESIELFVAAGESRGETWSRNGLGTALAGVGDYAQALAAFETAAATARAKGDGVIESMALNNLGTLAYDLGDPDLAIRQFQRARDLQLATGYRKGAFLPAFNVALCRLELGRLDEAERDLEALLQESRDESWPNLEALALQQLGSLALRRGWPREAARRFRTVLDSPALAKLKVAVEARLGLAQALGDIGEDDAALAVLEQGYRALAGAEDRALAVTVRLALGRDLLAAGRPQEALQHLTAAEAEAAALGLAGSRVEALARAAAAWRELASPDSSLALLRRGAGVWAAERSVPRDPEWRERLGSSGRLLYSDLAHALLEERVGRPPAERSRAAFEALQGFKARTLLERMLGPGPHPAEEPAAIELAALQSEVLAPGELLLDLYLGDEGSLLFAVSTDECRAVELPPAPELTEPALALHALLARRPGPGSQAADTELAMAGAAAMRERLFGDVEDLIARSRRVFLSPDGALNLLPSALLDACGEPREWLRVPSAAVLARLRAGEGSAPSSVRGLALAGLDPDGERVLPGARREVEALSARYRDVQARLPGAGDSLPVGPAALNGHGLLHLAAHASVDDQNPWQSSLHLGAAGGRISAGEIARSRLDARLTVLAACSSANGRLLSGEGVAGLASAFLSAGVPAVVATLWPVDDAASARLSERFYRSLAEGRSIGRALQEARRALRADPATAHPFFWSGFVLVGDGALELPLSERPLLQRHAGRLLALLAGLVLLLLALRGRGFSRRRV